MGTGTGTGQFLNAKIPKEYSKEIAPNSSTETETGMDKIGHLKYGDGICTPTPTPGYGTPLL